MIRKFPAFIYLIFCPKEEMQNVVDLRLNEEEIPLKAAPLDLR